MESTTTLGHSHKLVTPVLRTNPLIQPSEFRVDDDLDDLLQQQHRRQQHHFQHHHLVDINTFWSTTTPSGRQQHRHQQHHIVDNSITTSTTARVNRNRSPEARLGSFDSCFRRSWNPTACGIWQKRRISAPVQALTSLGEPKIEC